jgi:hypothetical protein
MPTKLPGEEKRANPATASGHAQAINRLRRQRLVEHLHRLGPSPVGHFLNEVERGASVAERLERYSRIDPEFVRALGGDKFATSLWAIDGGRR